MYDILWEILNASNLPVGGLAVKSHVLMINLIRWFLYVEKISDKLDISIVKLNIAWDPNVILQTRPRAVHPTRPRVFFISTAEN